MMLQGTIDNYVQLCINLFKARGNVCFKILFFLLAERVAVKIIDKGKLDVKTQKMVSREINIMDSLSHPNLIR